jgi:phosphoglycolate phosphatase-like HAD superfamily hydrolase
VIKAVIFDFDGVIVESAELKKNAYELIFKEYTDDCRETLDYFITNSGFSRFIIFRYFFENTLKKEYTDSIGEILSKRYSGIVLQEVINAPFVDGAEEFLKKNHTRFLTFIATGTPHKEILYIAEQRGIDSYFDGIFGSPELKQKIINTILKEYGLKNDEVVFVGDAESDLTAALDTGVHFVARITEYNEEMLKECKYKIPNISGLERIIADFG